MSGGSFDYLCYHEFDRRSDLMRMSEALDSVRTAEGQRAATATLDIAAAMEPSDELREVWRAVEWWKSGDYGIDQVHEALSKWRPA